MPELILAPCVEDELWAIWRFIARDSPDAATRVVEAAYETFNQLAERPHPGRARKFSHPHLNDVRSCPVTGFASYLIFYRPTPNGIAVLHLYHGAVDIEGLFRVSS